MLEAIDLVHVILPQDRTDLALNNEVVRLLRGNSGEDDSGCLIELAHFLVQRHLFQQILGLLLRMQAEGAILSTSQGGSGNRQRQAQQGSSGRSVQMHRCSPRETGRRFEIPRELFSIDELE